MAQRVWTGVDGNFQTTTNWNPNGTLTNGDILHFTGASQQDVTLGLSNGSLNVDINVHDDYTGTIAASGGKLILGNSTFRMNGRGSKAYIDITGTAVAYITSAHAVADFFELDCTAAGLLYVVGCSGSLSVTAGASLGRVYLEDSPNCTLTIPSGVTDLYDVYCGSGHLMLSSSVEDDSVNTITPRTMVVGPGQITIDGAAAFNDSQGGYVRVGRGGKIIHKASGTIAELWVHPLGTFDGRRNRNGTADVTITQAYVFPKSNLLLNNGLDTYAASVTPIGGGNYSYETGQTASV